MASAEELTSVATLVASVLAALLILATLLRARPEVVGSRLGWALVALGVLFFAARVLGHFTEDPALQGVRHAAGIAGSALLVSGFAAIQRQEGRAPAR